MTEPLHSYGVAWLSQQCDEGLTEIWTAEYNVRLEREIWVTVMEAQRDLGLNIPDWVVRSSEWYRDNVPADTTQLINDREQITRHDVKARLEIFCEQAGHEFHHLGMTSADIVDNAMQIKILRSAQFLEQRYGIELPFIRRYLMRGIKGAVGTQQDQLDLLGSAEACGKLDEFLARQFGFGGVMHSTGQVYPRSQDLEVLSELMVATCRPGAEEAFRQCLAGFMHMAAMYSGDQWNEGDVSTSVVRRVCIPGAFFAAAAALRGCHQDS